MEGADFPAVEKNKGRPSYAPDDATRARAADLAADGLADDVIAERLAISAPTLRKHHAADLATGRARIQPDLPVEPAGSTAPAFADPTIRDSRIDALLPSAAAPSSDAGAAPLDQFGDATAMVSRATPSRAAGRPRYVPNRADRDAVRVLAAANIGHANIARRLGISEPTLRRAFADELRDAAEMMRAEIIESLRRKARAGSVAAMVQLKAIIDEAELSRFGPRAPAAPEKPERETAGKKVVAARAADRAATEGKWAQLSRLIQ